MENKDLIPVGGGLLGAGLVYKYLRTPRNLTSLQKAINDKGLLINLSYGASKFRKALGKAVYSKDIDFAKINTDKLRVSDKVIYNKNIEPLSKDISSLSINDQTVYKNLFSTALDKSKLPDLPSIGGMFPKTKKLENVLQAEGIAKERIKDLGVDELKAIFEKIEQKHGPQFLKPEYGQSMGKGRKDIYAPLSQALNFKRAKGKFFKSIVDVPNSRAHEEIKNNLSKYILTDYLGTGKEARLHIVNDKIVDVVRRFGGFEGTKAGFKFLSPAEKLGIESKLKSLYKAKNLNTEKHPVIFGLDAMRDKNNKVRFIEMNPNSGFLFNLTDITTKSLLKPWEYGSSHRVYKHLTGKHTSASAGLKSLTAGTGLYFGGREIQKKAEFDLAPVAAAAAVGAGLFFRNRLKNPSRFFHVVPSNTALLRQSKLQKLKNFLQFGDVKHVTIDEFLKTPTKVTDTAYFDLPNRLLEGRDVSHKSSKLINIDTDIINQLSNKITMNKYISAPNKIEYAALPTEVADAETLFKTLRKNMNLGEGEKILVKPTTGLKSRGIFLHSDEIGTGSKPIKLKDEIKSFLSGEPIKYTSPNFKFKEIQENPADYVATRFIPNKNEYRVTALNDKIVDIKGRHNLVLPLDEKSVNEVQKAVSSIYQNIKKEKNLKGDLYLGHDIIMHKNKPYIVDINDQEGFFWVYPNKLYKRVSKKNLSNVQLAKSSLAGTGAFVGTKMLSPDKQK